MYKTALQNAKTAGESSKARRYDRGLKVRHAEGMDLHQVVRFVTVRRCDLGSHFLKHLM